MTTNCIDPRRAAIERELQERLARDRQSGRVTASAVGLMCVSCRAVSGGDALFCTGCGVKFNAVVVAPAEAPAGTPGGSL